ncbi:L-serine ammonia-lyase, iron-sulfur-dependent, subunit alpha [Desulfitibacter alkalitolerans]|uniref:L-serine ammonia-lyase, iron-sulfur-dependent, subunit alpha n=1 Tax=Desulfitibacter alkalitolerans TaxID=264641 RepID=UPI0004865C6B|nr:L-serine ammonia-lyase, iron-sulfur-dependent, subunit alpha [Desulfitibacter alkalitolerans]
MEKYNSLKEWVSLADKYGISLAEVVVKWEASASGKSEAEIRHKMYNNLMVMKKSIEDGLEKKEATMGGLANGEAVKVRDAVKNGVMPDDRISRVSYRALAVSELNAAMGCIVAAPTAGSCGILPAILITVAEEKNSSKEELVEALFVASGIGIIIAEKATIAGAEGGCQAECGSAASMAAGAVVYLNKGTAEQVLDAAALALKNSLGLVCDPVAGLVEVPCIKRNAFLAVQALVAADLALAGVKSVIPADEVISAMSEIGREMASKYKETAQGGLAATPTGIRIMKELLGNNKQYSL